MADSTEATVEAPGSSSTPESSSVPESSAASESCSAPEIKPAEVKRSWGDEVDEEFTIDQLSIKESKDLDEPEDSNIKAVITGDTPYTSAKKFEDLNLSEELTKGLYVEMRFERPSKVQSVTLPMILTPPYRNLIAQAHNGSGKTTCFVLGMLSRVDPKQQAPQALCICPTRELAIQNLEVLKKMGKYTGISAERAVPENLDNPAHTPISKRPPVTSQVIIGTPGTIKKWMSFRKLSMSSMKILVFDEADHMLAEGGFKDDSLRIMNDIKRSAPSCQVLLFSATFSERVKAFVKSAIQDYNQLFVKKEELSLQSVKQFKVRCPGELEKVQVVREKILELCQKVGQTIIFVRTRNSASYLHKALVDLGYEVTTIQGALTHDDRDKIVKEFKDGLTKVLISTDVLARGFDQSQVNLVVNYDLPVKHDPNKKYDPNKAEPDCEVYLHRVGRAGRFGRKGAVFNLICDDIDNKVMGKIENHFGCEVIEVPDYRNDEDFEKALKDAGLL
ncbi:hypothetical protein SOVF_010730 [Spinacia oleracea]|uniref:RNA helicase n=1 Tax=Spinacia oleracea TaxID=3562 RepID=A0A9R0J5M6_SPIOL|nr:DEAD-box ATP-dependent RNA helicase 38 [Spinacia oleracea]KNA24983.1 hypothetical protein SOVF_010730 [Spinacia oleracea]